MAEFPAIPLWTDALLADCSHLDDAELGRYMRILIEMWRTPRQRLPNDDAWLARRFRRSVEDVRAQVRPLLEEFCQSDGNWWTQKRLLREWKHVSETTARRSAAAKAKWQKQKKRQRASANKQDASTYRADAPTPTPPLKNHEREDARRAKTNGALIPHRGPTRGLRSMADIMGQEKRKKNQAVADQGMAKFLMEKMSYDFESAQEAVLAARDPENPQHRHWRKLLEKISFENTLGWFGSEAA